MLNTITNSPENSDQVNSPLSQSTSTFPSSLVSQEASKKDTVKRAFYKSFHNQSEDKLLFNVEEHFISSTSSKLVGDAVTRTQERYENREMPIQAPANFPNFGYRGTIYNYQMQIVPVLISEDICYAENTYQQESLRYIDDSVIEGFKNSLNEQIADFLEKLKTLLPDIDSQAIDSIKDEVIKDRNLSLLFSKTTLQDRREVLLLQEFHNRSSNFINNLLAKVLHEVEIFALKKEILDMKDASESYKKTGQINLQEQGSYSLSGDVDIHSFPHSQNKRPEYDEKTFVSEVNIWKQHYNALSWLDIDNPELTESKQITITDIYSILHSLESIDKSLLEELQSFNKKNDSLQKDEAISQLKEFSQAIAELLESVKNNHDKIELIRNMVAVIDKQSQQIEALKQSTKLDSDIASEMSKINSLLKQIQKTDIPAGNINTDSFVAGQLTAEVSVTSGNDPVVESALQKRSENIARIERSILEIDVDQNGASRSSISSSGSAGNASLKPSNASETQLNISSVLTPSYMEQQSSFANLSQGIPGLSANRGYAAGSSLRLIPDNTIGQEDLSKIKFIREYEKKANKKLFDLMVNQANKNLYLVFFMNDSNKFLLFNYQGSLNDRVLQSAISEKIINSEDLRSKLMTESNPREIISLELNKLSAKYSIAEAETGNVSQNFKAILTKFHTKAVKKSNELAGSSAVSAVMSSVPSSSSSSPSNAQGVALSSARSNSSLKGPE